jgi:hypothetical protein
MITFRKKEKNLIKAHQNIVFEAPKGLVSVSESKSHEEEFPEVWLSTLWEYPPRRWELNGKL